MIKGVNKQIIELTDTGNLYYEKAWLVVKPEYTAAQEQLLLSEARKILKGAGLPSTMKPKRSAKYLILPTIIASLVGAGVATFVGLLI